MTTQPLTEFSCKALPAGTPPLTDAECRELLKEIDPIWSIEPGPLLFRHFKLPDFQRALALTQTIGELADAEDHHPEIRLGLGMVEVRLSTHSVGGLSRNDFILAAKIDRHLALS